MVQIGDLAVDAGEFIIKNTHQIIKHGDVDLFWSISDESISSELGQVNMTRIPFQMYGMYCIMLHTHVSIWETMNYMHLYASIIVVLGEYHCSYSTT